MRQLLLEAQKHGIVVMNLPFAGPWQPMLRHVELSEGGAPPKHAPPLVGNLREATSAGAAADGYSVVRVVVHANPGAGNPHGVNPFETL